MDAEGYDERIRRTIPDYDGIVDAVASRILDSGCVDWLDAGCGTGEAVSRVLFSRHIGVTLLDSSEQMLSEAGRKLGDRCTYVFGDIRDLPFPSDSFDAVSCILCLHYLRPEERIPVFSRIYDILRPGGVFVYAEHIIPEDPCSAEAEWRRFLIDRGRTPEEADTYLGRKGREYFPLTVDDHLRLLNDAGFCDATVLMVSCSQAVLAARK